MTEKRTLALNSRQWRVLLHDNLEVLKAAVAGTETINEEGLRQISSQLDDMKMLASAWFQVSAPKEPTADVPAASSGVTAPKKRGRKSNAERAAQAMQ